MKRNIYMAMLAAFAAANANAQDTYELTNLMSSDLNGTAKYVGMGGALNALGADMSTMQSNPAGIGLMRKSDVSVSASTNMGDESRKYIGHGDSFTSFDQIGVVFCMKHDSTSPIRYSSIGINYHRNKAYNNAFFDTRNISGLGISQTYQMEELNNSLGSYSTLANIGYNTGLLSPITTDNGDGTTTTSSEYYGIDASAYDYRRYDKGYNSEYDVDWAFNLENQFYFGVTLGFYDLSHETGSIYGETNSEGGYEISNFRRTEGSGIDVKLGTIIRPIEDNPFRFGIAISTPTYYDMTVMYSEAYINVPYTNAAGQNLSYDISTERYNYRVVTPWKFNLSAATTFGTQLAIDAEYEYQDWSSLRLEDEDGNEERVITGLNSESLRGVSTFKIGAEYRFIPSAALRIGYNHVSPMYIENAFRNLDPSCQNYGASYSNVTEQATSTEYCNWYGINRLTCGLGFKFDHVYLDLAYQYSCQKGDFYAFDDYQSFANRKLMPTEVKNKRNQVLLTLGYKF